MLSVKTGWQMMSDNLGKWTRECPKSQSSNSFHYCWLENVYLGTHNSLSRVIFIHIAFDSFAPITQQLQRGQQQKNSRLKHQTIFLRKNRIFQTEFVTLNIEIKRVHMYTNIPSRLGEFADMTTDLKYFLHFSIRWKCRKLLTFYLSSKGVPPLSFILANSGKN